jgi:dihydroneopterin aldolase
MRSASFLKKAFTNSCSGNKFAAFFMGHSFSIQLKKLRFFANHGLYEGEDQLGNEFELSLEMRLATGSKKKLELNDTINYARAYEIIHSRMMHPFGLLENLAIAIADDLETEFPQCISLQMEILKLYPPIPCLKGSVGIRYERKMR